MKNKKKFFFIFLLVFFVVVNPWLLVYCRSALFTGFLNKSFSGQDFFSNYFFLLSGKFLFFNGAWPIASKALAYQGMFLLPELVFLIFGFVSLIYEKNRFGNIVMALFFILPIPAALTNIIWLSIFMLIPALLIIVKGASRLFEKPMLFFFLMLGEFFFEIRFLDLLFLHP
ncbi:MAG: hypothetical protein M1514_02230 [Patescibacteria group bacterium]|nr:hypothetical protein [Patescibacteria group bacterium]